MQPGNVSFHTPSSLRSAGVSGASRRGTLPSGLSLKYSNFAVARSAAGICAMASALARSCMSRTKGRAQCAECNATSASRPSNTRCTTASTRGVSTSPCFWWPHQTMTCAASSSASESPWLGMAKLTEVTLRPGCFARYAAMVSPRKPPS